MFAMQGQVPDENNKVIITHLKETILKAHSIQDFLDYNMINVPKRSEIKGRILFNYNKYQGNYLIIVILFTFMFVCIRRSIIFILALWAAYFYFVKQGEQSYNLKGVVIKKDWLFKGLVVFSALYGIFLFDILFSLMACVSLVGVLLLIHMIFFFDEDQVVDDENKV